MTHKNTHTPVGVITVHRSCLWAQIYFIFWRIKISYVLHYRWFDSHYFYSHTRTHRCTHKFYLCCGIFLIRVKQKIIQTSSRRQRGWCGVLCVIWRCDWPQVGPHVYGIDLHIIHPNLFKTAEGGMSNAVCDITVYMVCI